jgi:maltokinase
VTELRDLATIRDLAAAYLERQPWYLDAVADAPDAELALVSSQVLLDGRPGLAQLVLARAGQRFQLIIGWRDPSEVAKTLHGRESALLGSWDDGEGNVLVFDAIADDECAIALLQHVTDRGEEASRVRRVSSLHSHASLVFDERLFMKCYRVLDRGVRPEVEVMLRLDELGFNALLAPVGHWRENGTDLALVREFLPSALEGRLLALTSLRDLLAHASGHDSNEPSATGGAPLEDDLDADLICATAGGDLASEMRRLGMTTGRLHLALATAFGEQEAGPASFSAVGPDDSLAALLVAAPAGAFGRTIRLHGDYHLRRVMRFEAGWLVAGFSDDPLIAKADGDAPASGRRGTPIEDLADFCFSLADAAEEAVGQRPESEAQLAGQLAAAWVRRNTTAFLDGYLATEGIERLVPSDRNITELVLARFSRLREDRYEATSAEA